MVVNDCIGVKRSMSFFLQEITFTDINLGGGCHGETSFSQKRQTLAFMTSQHTSKRRKGRYGADENPRKIDYTLKKISCIHDQLIRW